MDFAACTAGANRAPPASAVPKAAEPFRKLRRFGRSPWKRLGMAFLPSSGPKRRPIGTRLAFPPRLDGSVLTRSWLKFDNRTRVRYPTILDEVSRRVNG